MPIATTPMAGSIRVSKSIIHTSFAFVAISIFKTRAWILLWNLVVRLITIVLAFPVPSTLLVATSSFMIIATRGCAVHFEGNNIYFLGQDWWFFISSSLFCSATKSTYISWLYSVKPRALYCYCKSTLDAWNVLKVFSSISSSLMVSSQSFIWEVILNKSELHSAIDLKSWIFRWVYS